MKVTLTVCCFLFALMCCAQDSLLVEQLRQHRYPVTLKEGVLEGEGARWLQQETAGAQFVLIGEGHGFAEPPRFTAAVYNLLYPAGFKYFVSETGPSAMRLLTPLLQEKDPQHLNRFFQAYPMAFAFHAYQEEAQMLRDILQTARYAPRTVWGIDQEFFLSPAPYFHHLAGQSRGKASKSLLEQYAQRADAETAAMLQTKNFSKLTLHALTPEDFQALRQAVGKDEMATRLIGDLQRSQHVYATRSAYASNVLRIELMKENLMKQYRQAQAAGDAEPKAIFKFGATHMYRGKSLLGFYDIGNLASELAASNNKTSLHILLAGDRGTVNDWRLVNDKATQQADYNGREVFKSLGIQPLYALLAGKEWQLVDLRPARELIYSGKLKHISKQLQDTIWGYDVILLMPEVTASTNF